MTIKSIFNKIYNFFRPKPQKVVSTAPTIQILVDGLPVGVVQSLTLNETRGAPPVVKATRVVFNREQVAAAFYKGYVNKHSQFKPLDIVINDEVAKTTIHGSWIDRIASSYTTNEHIFVENMMLICDRIFSKKKD